MVIVREKERKYRKETELTFYDRETNEARWGFPMTGGVVVPLDSDDEQCDEKDCTWWKNYIAAKKNTNLYSEITINKWYYDEPAVGICDVCGHEVILENDFYGSCECKHCGQWYTLSGQQCLPPNEQMECEDW